MSLMCIACTCGSSDSLIRNFLKQVGYAGWMSIPITKGKVKSRSVLGLIPKFPEVEMLDNFLRTASKWAVIIGWDDNSCRWSDIAHDAAKSRIEAEFVVKTFGGPMAVG